jgi:hypothetical protein
MGKQGNSWSHRASYCIQKTKSHNDRRLSVTRAVDVARIPTTSVTGSKRLTTAVIDRRDHLRTTKPATGAEVPRDSRIPKGVDQGWFKGTDKRRSTGRDRPK